MTTLPFRRKGVRWTPGAFALCVTMVVLLVAHVAAAQSSDSDLLAQLGHEDYFQRDAAERAMMADATLTIERLAKLYERAENPEQRHRLLRVARHYHLRMVAQSAENFAHLADHPVNGAVGIPQDAVNADQVPDVGRPAVRVRETFPGFPSHQYLKRDDLILAVDGQTLPRTSDPDITFLNFKKMLGNHQAGSQVTFTVYREGRTMDVTLTLAHGAALAQMYQARDRLGSPLDEGIAFNWNTVRHQRFAAPPSDDPALTVDWP